MSLDKNLHVKPNAIPRVTTRATDQQKSVCFSEPVSRRHSLSPTPSLKSKDEASTAVVAKDRKASVYAIPPDELADLMREFGLESNLEDRENDLRSLHSSVQNMIEGLGIETKSEHDEMDFDEFVEMVARTLSEEGAKVTEKDFQRVFAFFDRNSDGYIDFSELKQVMLRLDESLTHADLNDMIIVADQDGDGKVSYDEFVEVIKSSLPLDELDDVATVQKRLSKSMNDL